jgi:two-component system sensor histidine kinase CpxA
MRSLFAKILLWFSAVVVVTAVGSGVIFRLVESEREFDRQGPRFGMLTLQLEGAREAYETGGPAALREFLGRPRGPFRFGGFLTDSEGKNLVTGESDPGLIQRAQRSRGPFRYKDRRYFARPSEDGRYWFFLPLRGEPPMAPFRQQWLLWMVPAVVLLCWGLARYLTAPLRSLEQAVIRFGKGDFSARAASTRGDELGRLARTFDQMAERIQALLGSQRRLLLDISHELRSPLTRLGLAVELARSGSDREAALDRIQKEADRLNALVGELLTITRAEADPASMRFGPVRVDELLRDIADICSVEASARETRLEVSDLSEVTIEGDDELLRRALENVIRNAIRYAPPNTKVEVSLEKTHAGLTIRVRDQGPGVPESSLPHLFEPFYRVEGDRSRASGGTGLGLAIARRAVDLHQGKITARNAQPGLLVEITLPELGVKA